MTLTFDRLTPKSIGFFSGGYQMSIPSLVEIGHLVLDLSSGNESVDGRTDGQTDGRTDGHGNYYRAPTFHVGP